MIELSKWKVAYQAEQETSAEIVQSRMTSWEYIRWWGVGFGLLKNSGSEVYKRNHWSPFLLSCLQVLEEEKIHIKKEIPEILFRPMTEVA